MCSIRGCLFITQHKNAAWIPDDIDVTDVLLQDKWHTFTGTFHDNVSEMKWNFPLPSCPFSFL